MFDTTVGACGIVWSADGVVGVHLPEGTRARTAARIEHVFAPATEKAPAREILAAIDAIRRHLDGELDDLRSIRLDMSAITDFDRDVYRVTRDIDPGATLTYGDVATALGSPGAAQAVGQALGRNPITVVIPCHRVLAAGNSVGGFSAGGGTVTKRELLAIEHAPGFDDPTLF